MFVPHFGVKKLGNSGGLRHSGKSGDWSLEKRLGIKSGGRKMVIGEQGCGGRDNAMMRMRYKLMIQLANEVTSIL